MIDGVIRKAIEEAIRFLGPGSSYTCEIDGHVFVFVRTSSQQPRYVVICTDCRAALELDADHRRAFLVAHRHTQLPPKESEHG